MTDKKNLKKEIDTFHIEIKEYISNAKFEMSSDMNELKEILKKHNHHGRGSATAPG